MSEETKVPQNTEVEETERAGQNKYESLQFNATINNRFSEELTVASPNISWGKFVEGPNNIPKKQVKIGFKAWGRQDSPSGTEGRVKYQVGKNPDKYFEINWSVPLSGSSSLDIKSSPDVKVDKEGWNGSYWSENVIITVGSAN